MEFRSEAGLGGKHVVNSVCWSRIFCKTNFLCHSVPFRASEWTLPYLGMSTFFRGITETVPSLEYFADYFRNGIPLPTLVFTLSRILRRMRALLVLLSLWCTCCHAHPQKERDQARNGIFKKINIFTYFMHVPNRICFTEITIKCVHRAFLGSASYAGRKKRHNKFKLTIYSTNIVLYTDQKY